MLQQLEKATRGAMGSFEANIKAMQSLMTEIRDNHNANDIWMMEAIQEICNKLDITLRDPLTVVDKKVIDNINKKMEDKNGDNDKL